jgi:hypothetical protein
MQQHGFFVNSILPRELVENWFGARNAVIAMTPDSDIRGA